MKPMICTIRSGIRRRSRPRRMSCGLGGRREGQRRGHADRALREQPEGGDQSRLGQRQAEYVDARADGDEGHQDREEDERHLDHHALADVGQRHARCPDDRDHEDCVDREGGVPLPRRGHHQEHEADQDQQLVVRRPSGAAGRGRGSAAGGRDRRPSQAWSAVSVTRDARAARQKSPPPTSSVVSEPTTPATPPLRRSLSMPWVE